MKYKKKILSILINGCKMVKSVKIIPIVSYFSSCAYHYYWPYHLCFSSWLISLSWRLASDFSENIMNLCWVEQISEPVNEWINEWIRRVRNSREEKFRLALCHPRMQSECTREKYHNPLMGSTLKRRLLKIKNMQNELRLAGWSQRLWSQNYSNSLINHLMCKPCKQDHL